MFDEPTKKIVYTKQTEEAKSKGISNCPLCALENNSNKKKIWKLSEMDADHVTAWSKGGERILVIVKCFVKHIIGQKEINRNYYWAN